MDRRSFMAAGIAAAEALRSSLRGGVMEQLGFGARSEKVDRRKVRRLSKAAHFTLFEPGIAAAYRVRPGEIVLVECSHGLPGLVTRDGRFTKPGPGDKINPATGPIYVEGVRPEDGLAIDLLDIRTGDWGYCAEHVYEIRDGQVIVSNRTRLPAEPMLGVVGITPAAGSMDTRRPAETGGNMDCRDVRVGTTVVFTTQVPGAMAGFGDAHALQGDGEIAGQGLETDAEVILRFRVLPQKLSARPVLLRPGFVYTVGAHEDLAEAAWQATDDMVKLVARTSGRADDESRVLVNLLGRLIVNQIVDPSKGARMEMPAWVFAPQALH